MKLTILHEIVERVRNKVATDKSETPVAELKRRISDARPVVSFSKSIAADFGLIAEIKRRSPSQGLMRHQVIPDIARIYQEHSFVRAVSVVTNRDDFKMSIKDLAETRELIAKPILRKDFIVDEYQVYEARAFGADAILLMASILTDPKRIQGLFDLSTDLGMDVLFECRDRAEIDAIPSGAKVYGINSRKLKAKKVFGFSRFTAARVLRRFPGNWRDTSVQHSIFDLAKYIPKHALKVAESGLVPAEIGNIRDNYGYNSALVGTAILNAPEGVKEALDAFNGLCYESRFAATEMAHSR
jgi:indole-3-glycerol phosphate synthase